MAENVNTPIPLLEKLAEDAEEHVYCAVAGNPNATNSTLQNLFKDRFEIVRDYYAGDYSFDRPFFNLFTNLAIYELSADEMWPPKASVNVKCEDSKSSAKKSSGMTKTEAKKIKSVIKKKMNASVSELRSNFAWASMERWTLKNAFDFIKTEESRDLVDEVLQDYDSEIFECSELDFNNLCEEVYAELSLKYQ